MIDEYRPMPDTYTSGGSVPSWPEPDHSGSTLDIEASALPPAFLTPIASPAWWEDDNMVVMFWAICAFAGFVLGYLLG